MEKLTEEQIKNGNRLIAEFMGYTYYHKGVDIDYSDIGGLYERFEVFSKVPILVDEYPEDDQYYFSRMPNPDYGNKNNPRWNPNLEKLEWNSINYMEYKTDLKYYEDWNQLMPVYIKLVKLMDDDDNEDSIAIFNVLADRLIDGDGIEAVFEWTVKWIENYNLIKNA